MPQPPSYQIDDTRTWAFGRQTFDQDGRRRAHRGLSLPKRNRSVADISEDEIERRWQASLDEQRRARQAQAS